MEVARGCVAIILCIAIVFIAISFPIAFVLDRWTDQVTSYNQAEVARATTEQVQIIQSEETKRESKRQDTLLAIMDRQEEGMTERQALISNVDLKTSWAYVFDDVWTKALIVWLVAIGLALFHWKGKKS